MQGREFFKWASFHQNKGEKWAKGVYNGGEKGKISPKRPVQTGMPV